jgi:fused signal recognition particle receptor
MFDGLRQRLYQFKEAVSTKELKLDNDEAKISASDTSPHEVGREEASSILDQQQDSPCQMAAEPAGEYALAGGSEPIATRKSADKRSFFLREIKEKDLEEPLWDLEIALLESDVAVSVSEEILEIVKKQLVGTKRRWREDVSAVVEQALRDGISSVIEVSDLDFDEVIKNGPKPITVVFTGINGTGKTTTIAKIAYRLKKQGYGVVLAAGDTYRAGALEQIDLHATNLGIKLIKHRQGADPAAVIFDAVQYAQAKHKDVVLADTAGRIHTNVNLMNQLKKIDRVIGADVVVFVDEALAGNDAVERALQFNEAMAIDGSILTKVDADSRGGTAISIAHATGKPILFLGVGQQYEDLVKFDPQWLLGRIFGEANT